jgi:hypothetical protein
MPTAAMEGLHWAFLITSLCLLVISSYHLFVVRIAGARQKPWTFPSRVYALIISANVWYSIYFAGTLFAPSDWVMGLTPHSTVIFHLSLGSCGFLASDIGNHFAIFWLRTAPYSSAKVPGAGGSNPRTAANTNNTAATPPASSSSPTSSPGAAAFIAVDPSHTSNTGSAAAPSSTHTSVLDSAFATAESFAAQLDQNVPLFQRLLAYAQPIVMSIGSAVAYHATAHGLAPTHSVPLAQGAQPRLVTLIGDDMEAAAIATILCWAFSMFSGVGGMILSVRQVEKVLDAEQQHNPLFSADPITASLKVALKRMRMVLLTAVWPVVPVLCVFAASTLMRHRAALLPGLAFFATGFFDTGIMLLFKSTGRSSTNSRNVGTIAPLPPPHTAAGAGAKASPSPAAGATLAVAAPKRPITAGSSPAVAWGSSAPAPMFIAADP